MLELELINIEKREKMLEEMVYTPYLRHTYSVDSTQKYKVIPPQPEHEVT